MRTHTASQDVDAAEDPEYYLDPATGLCGIGSVDLVGTATATPMLGVCADLSRRRGIGIIGQRHIAARIDKGSCDLATDPATRSGDKRDLSGQAGHWTTRLQPISTMSRGSPRVMNTIL